MKDSEIYKLELHQSYFCEIPSLKRNLYDEDKRFAIITKVPGGWLYQIKTVTKESEFTSEPIFVPYRRQSVVSFLDNLVTLK